MSKENKFVVMSDDTKGCCEQDNCRRQVAQGHPIQQVFIDLSQCKRQEEYKHESYEEKENKSAQKIII